MDAEDLAAIEQFVALSIPASRQHAARRIAQRCRAEELLLFVSDMRLGTLLPAPGFPPTLSGGASWRTFIRQCAKPGRREARVELPAGRQRTALAIVPGGIAAVLIGDNLDQGEVARCERLLPMLAHALQAEQLAGFASSEAAFARTSASRAKMLADALEAARAEHARLNAVLHEEHRRKDDFLAMLAHELRNPLTPLVTTIELIRRAGGRADERHLSIMARQARQLSRLVEDLLDVSRVSRGRIELRRHRIRLDDVVNDAIEASRSLMEGRRHQLLVTMPREPIYVDADNVRLAQVFANLLHNAGKYTDPGGVIRVEVAREADTAVVSVTDNGVGIDPATLASVFDLFVQARTTLARADGGLGIGLTLVRALIELHGGEVRAESRGIGQGSTFTVRLPVSTAKAPSQAPVRRVSADGEVSLRILVVDDNEDAANSLGDILRIMGHHAEVAFGAAAALQVAADVDPDLVFLDIGLPEMDGYEVARRLRRSLRRDVRLVALTGYGTEEDKRRSREAGFDEHVTKPLLPEAISAITRRAAAASVLPGP